MDDPLPQGHELVREIPCGLRLYRYFPRIDGEGQQAICSFEVWHKFPFRRLKRFLYIDHGVMAEACALCWMDGWAACATAKEHIVQVYGPSMPDFRRWLQQPNGAHSPNWRLTFEAVEDGGVLVRVKPYALEQPT